MRLAILAAALFLSGAAQANELKHGFADSLAAPYLTAVQQKLKERGYYSGPISGAMSEQLAAATRNYQKSAGLPVNGTPDMVLINSLNFGGMPSPAAVPAKTASAGGAAPDPLVKAIQSKLASHGYDVGAIDGRMGRKTADAIRQFETKNAMPVTGHATKKLLEILNGKKPDAPKSESQKSEPPKSEAPKGDASKVDPKASGAAEKDKPAASLAPIAPAAAATLPALPSPVPTRSVVATPHLDSL